jgi:7-carboxy-7-deazaguanine synthase
MKIAEIFASIQGEGRLAGTPSAFIRTSGCNLRCSWCDTPYTSWDPEGDQLTPDQILEQVAELDRDHVVLTGGEPMIAPGVEALTRRLKEAGYHLTIETAGTVWKDVACDLASVSPKLANSTPSKRDARWAERHERDRINVEVIRRFTALSDYQLKFVVERPADLDEIESLLSEIGGVDRARVLLMPQAVTPSRLEELTPEVERWCEEHGFTFGPRLHILLFGNSRGK